MTELGGRPLLEWQVNVLKKVGIEKIVVVTGYKNSLIQIPKVEYVKNEAWADTNMVESLFIAESHFGKDLLVSYSDIICEPRVILGLLDSPHDISVSIDIDWRRYWEARFETPELDAESLKLDGQNRILQIGDDVSSLEGIEGQYIGLMRFQNTGIQTLKDVHKKLAYVDRPWKAKRNTKNAYMTDLLMEIIIEGYDIHAVLHEAGWMEIDTVADLKLAQKILGGADIKRFNVAN